MVTTLRPHFLMYVWLFPVRLSDTGHPFLNGFFHCRLRSSKQFELVADQPADGNKRVELFTSKGSLTVMARQLDMPKLPQIFQALVLFLSAPLQAMATGLFAIPFVFQSSRHWRS